MSISKDSATPWPPPASSLPSPPFIDIPGVPNFRDLGGYPIDRSPSYSIRRNFIYRCGEPSRITKEGIAKLQELGITHAYDLRSQPEIDRAKTAGYGEIIQWEGCERVFAPVFAERDYSPEGLALRFKQYAREGTEVKKFSSQGQGILLILQQGYVVAYTEIMQNAPPSYGTILRRIANEPEKPLIIHCTAGKDRTGVLCALILSLCGVEDDVIAEEYALTDVGLPITWKRSVISHLMENPGLKGNEAGAWNLISSK